MKRTLLAGMLAASCVSCSSVSSSSERLIGAPAFPPTLPESVSILRREPPKPHVRLGHVYIEPSGTPPVEDIEKAIREEAAKLGADAAVIVLDRTKRIGTVYEGPWWDRRAYPVVDRKIVAVAIRYRRERETG